MKREERRRRRLRPAAPAALAGFLFLALAVLPGGSVHSRGGYTPPNLPVKPPVVQRSIYFAPPALPAPRTAAAQWAVIVGISDYDGTGFDLQYCDDDARDVYNALTQVYGFPSSNIKMLLDSQATYANIMGAIDWLLAAEQERDTVVFYYSGHGSISSSDLDGDGETTDASIVPWELSRIYDGALAKKFGQLDASRYGRVWIGFDSCHSGGMTDAGITGANKTVTMACRQDEYASESSSVQNGYFTYLMVDKGMLQNLAAGFIPTPAPAPQRGQFAASNLSDRYHRPTCRYVKAIKAENLIWFGTAAEARARGYTPCRVCKPPQK